MAIKKRPLSPRQKMINLMYVVLMAMLALNVSTEVLEGFSIVEDSLNRTTRNAAEENQKLFLALKSQMEKNPTKTKEWYQKAQSVKKASDELYAFAQQLKIEIVKQADGDKGDVNKIKNKEDLEPASFVMLAPGTGKGKELYDRITRYRAQLLSQITDKAQRNIIASNLSTEVPQNERTLGKNWQEYMFEDMPVAAAVTLLSKLQSDIRYAEGEVLHQLLSNIDVKDIRVNKIDAFVIPESRTVVAGDRFKAHIVMAAVDTTGRPEIYIGNRKVQLQNNIYQFTASGIGEHSFSGYMTIRNANGDLIRRDFTQRYSVVAPSATVSADLMNVLYAGYDNPISISIPGIPVNAVRGSMSGGSFRQMAPGRFIARPSTVGQDVNISVSSQQDGTTRSIGNFSFHVRKLPDPTPFIPVGTDRFKGGKLSKAGIMTAPEVRAAIDDGILDIRFNVTGFETVFFDNMGNAVPMKSNGSNFSERQKGTMRTLSRGRRFYITNVNAVGPDGISRKLPTSIEVIVN